MHSLCHGNECLQQPVTRWKTAAAAVPPATPLPLPCAPLEQRAGAPSPGGVVGGGGGSWASPFAGLCRVAGKRRPGAHMCQGAVILGDPEASDSYLSFSHIFRHLSPPEDRGTRNAEGAQLHLNWKGVWVSSGPDRVACFNFLNKSWLRLQPVWGSPLQSVISRPQGRVALLGKIRALSGKGGCLK